MGDYVVTDLEIEKAEKDILGESAKFNDEQIAFLKCLDSCFLQAYAGTGKTSAIVSKLHILAQKKVWQNGRGICVISHTNVAIDEIKNRVAKHYPEVMKYPNFIGTIQEFVNKFLFSPYLAKQGLQIKFEDEYRDLNFDEFLFIKDRIKKYRKSIKRLGNEDADRQLNKFNKALSSCFLYEDEVCVYDERKIVAFLKTFKKLATKACTEDTISDALKICIQKEHSRSLFLYIESFIYSNIYLEQYSILSEIIAQRFQFVFLDEAQDCSEIQLSILNKLFDNNPKTIFQQVGDINQAITENECKWKSKNPLYLQVSIRFGQALADFVDKFRVDAETEKASKVIGSSNSAAKKYLILYDQPHVEDSILQKFSELLKNEKVGSNGGYFAISHQHKQLKELFSEYSENSSKNNVKNKTKFYRFTNDNEYLKLITAEMVRKNGSNFVSEILKRLLKKHLNTVSRVKVSLRTLLEVEDNGYEFRKLILKISQKILVDKLSEANMGTIANVLNRILQKKGQIKFEKQLSIKTLENRGVADNIYFSGEIEIKVRTIHSVKGQTHDATLFFSNKEWAKQDIEHVFNNTPKLTPVYKKLLYVASSRPRYLFAFAIERSAYENLTVNHHFEDFEKVEM